MLASVRSNLAIGRIAANCQPLEQANALVPPPCCVLWTLGLSVVFCPVSYVETGRVYCVRGASPAADTFRPTQGIWTPHNVALGHSSLHHKKASLSVRLFIPTALARVVMQSPLTVCPPSVTLAFEQSDLWPGPFACVWIITIALMGVRGQG